MRFCKYHGLTDWAKRKEGGYRCRKCSSEAVIRRRKKMKRILVEEHGGVCAICGYSKSINSLHFHHNDPSEKEFQISTRLNRSLTKLRKEAKKCILICANCHGELHENDAG